MLFPLPAVVFPEQVLFPFSHVLLQLASDSPSSLPPPYAIFCPSVPFSLATLNMWTWMHVRQHKWLARTLETPSVDVYYSQGTPALSFNWNSLQIFRWILIYAFMGINSSHGFWFWWAGCSSHWEGWGSTAWLDSTWHLAMHNET